MRYEYTETKYICLSQKGGKSKAALSSRADRKRKECVDSLRERRSILAGFGMAQTHIRVVATPTRLPMSACGNAAQT
ncbi:hypothetical protein EVAR_10100_1 [Eumeta japonica]|uniref:Uncharacterized protein n=1 Tax=Eumeta variegata TaxID=151549 RepID=A0A4C1UCB5_EUMVA|nr:hypothetical protein EVAR_10100_1 [Eumeta japonica]